MNKKKTITVWKQKDSLDVDGSMKGISMRFESVYCDDRVEDTLQTPQH